MAAAGELIARAARDRGMILFVDADSIVKYYPDYNMSDAFLQLLNRNYERVKYWLITEAVTTE